MCWRRLFSIILRNFECARGGPESSFWIFRGWSSHFIIEYPRGTISTSILNFPEGSPQIPLLKFHILRCEYVTFCEITTLQNSIVETLVTQSFVTKNNYVYNTRSTSFTPLCYTPFCSHVPCQFTPLLNLRSLIFGLTPFGWLHFIALFYFWWEHPFLFTTFLYALFLEKNN